MLQLGAVSAGAQRRIEPATRVVPFPELSPVLRLALKVPATVALVITFMLWVTSQPALVVSARTVGGGMIVGVYVVDTV
jgi:hypothetical protein